MSKDPAVLFYTSDFLTGTLTMSNEQVGKYIRLLCLQHQNYNLSEKDMLNICKTYDKDIFAKFIKTNDGWYYNERMRVESIRRRNYSESRRNNRLNTEIKDHDVTEGENKICLTYDKHMETINKDYISIYNKIKVELLNSEVWINDICVKYKIQPNNVKDSIVKFISDQMIEQPHAREFNEVRKHFAFWLKKQQGAVAPEIPAKKLYRSVEQVREEQRQRQAAWKPPED